MLIRCTRAFRDLKTAGKPMRAVGEEWEADASRLDEINRAGYGVMAEAVQDAPEGVEAVEDVPEPEDEGNVASDAATAPQRPTREELEGMTVKQLVELCESAGVDAPSKPRKAELVSLLSEYYGLE